MKYLIYFQEKAALDPKIAGHKFASLAKCHRHDLNVPPAVAISSEAHGLFIEEGKWPKGLLKQVLDAARELNLKEGISVRSSGVAEDLEEMSFAGQYETFLNVSSEKDLKDKIERCWASAQGENVESYRVQKGSVGKEMDSEEGGAEKISSSSLMGVILQKMVPASWAGVAFSTNPMFSGCDEVVVEAVEGLGDRLVSGKATPLRARIKNDDSLTIEKAWNESSDKSANQTYESLPPNESLPLEEKHWLSIARMARRAEQIAHGKPQDIEWAIDRDGKPWILQSRAITTLPTNRFTTPAGAWTRKIADDLWADRLTPFLADVMLQNAPRFDLTDIVEYLQIQITRPTLAVIDGFLYVNCQTIKDALSVVPSPFRTSDVLALLPPQFDSKQVPSPSKSRLARLALRLGALLLMVPESNPLVCFKLCDTRRKKLEKSIGKLDGVIADTPEKVFQKLERALEHFALIQENNRWPYSYATFFTWTLRWMMVDIARGSYADFLESLRGGGQNITSRIESRFKELAEEIRSDHHLKRLFEYHAPEGLEERLPTDFKTKLKDFLDHYGCRCRHRTLYMKRWAEAPEEVLAILKKLTLNSSGNIFEAERKRKKTVASVESFKKCSWRKILNPVAHLAGKYLDLREELRFLLDKDLFLIRKCLLSLGELTGLGEDVFFLEKKDLKKLTRGQISLEDARSKSAPRRKEFEKDGSAFTYIFDGCPVPARSEGEGRLRGIGTSAGRVTGTARVVKMPSDANLGHGDILIAENTDPGWTPVLSLAAGVAVQEGGLLNHCSIVARELGIPAVVGVRNILKNIPDGAKITIDGNSGNIEIH